LIAASRSSPRPRAIKVAIRKRPGSCYRLSSTGARTPHGRLAGGKGSGEAATQLDQNDRGG
jgi:hypothetical protein